VMKTELLEKIETAGVVGAGGAGFPTHVKLNSSPEFLLINAAECEPLLAVDQLLMEHYAPLLISTCIHIAQAMQVKQAVVAVKKKYTQAIAAMRDAIESQPADVRVKCELALLEDLYPAGDEQVAVYEIFSRIVPEGNIPLAVGIVVINVETLLNIAHSLKGTPVTESFVTICGDVAQPITVRLPVGTSVRTAVAFASSECSPVTHLCLDGGPMTGQLVEDWEQPITKTTKGLVLIPRTHYLGLRYLNISREVTKNAVSICCACVQCTEICPRYLLGHSIEPKRLMVAEAQGLEHDARIFRMAHFCCECGLCDLWACFMNLSPRLLNVKLKRELQGAGIRPTPLKTQWSAHPLRETRRIPTARLKSKLQITEFDRPARFIESPEIEIRQVRLPLRQHRGVPATPCVKVGDHVNKGDLLAAPRNGELGARIHSSISGRITEITPQAILVEI
jgi:Na+-translocating ferredoxin:NAD+ oxidoreductase RnfC subunit